VRASQVKKFWAIYRSRQFHKELNTLFKKIESLQYLKNFKNVSSRKTISLIINRSPSYVTRSLQNYDRFVKSFKIKTFSHKYRISTFLIQVPRFKKLFEAFKKSKLTVRDFLNLGRFWEIPLKKCGPKDFAFLYYCLKRQGLEIKNARWFKKL